MLAAMAVFAVNDALTKLALHDVTTPQIMALRGIMATGLLLALAAFKGALRERRRLADPLLAFRAFADVGTTVTYLAALAHMPIANASAIYQALPLAVTLGAALFLHEPVGIRRWSAIGLGFVGVIVIVRPGSEGFSSFSLLVLLSVIFSVFRDLATRRMAPGVPSLLISATTSAAVTVVGFLLLPLWGWSPVSMADLVIFAFAAVCIALGYIWIVEAMRSGDMGVVAPFRYTILIFAIALGYIVFGDVPDVPMLIGSAIVVGSGGYSLYRERKRGRRPKVVPAVTH